MPNPEQDYSSHSHGNWEIQKRTLPADKIAQIDQIAQNLSLSDQTKGFLTRLVPNKLERLRKLSSAKILGSELQAREEMFQMLCETRKQAANEVYKEILVRGKAQLRKVTAEDFAAQLRDLSDKMNTIVDGYDADTTKAIEKARNQKEKTLRDATLRRIESTTVRFFASIEKLEQEFANILEEIKSSPPK